MDCTYCDESVPETATIRASVTVYPTDYEMRETSTRILCARCLDRLKNAHGVGTVIHWQKALDAR